MQEKVVVVRAIGPMPCELRIAGKRCTSTSTSPHKPLLNAKILLSEFCFSFLSLSLSLLKCMLSRESKILSRCKLIISFCVSLLKSFQETACCVQGFQGKKGGTAMQGITMP